MKQFLCKDVTYGRSKEWTVFWSCSPPPSVSEHEDTHTNVVVGSKLLSLGSNYVCLVKFFSELELADLFF